MPPQITNLNQLHQQSHLQGPSTKVCFRVWTAPWRTTVCCFWPNLINSGVTNLTNWDYLKPLQLCQCSLYSAVSHLGPAAEILLQILLLYLMFLHFDLVEKSQISSKSQSSLPWRSQSSLPLQATRNSFESLLWQPQNWKPSHALSAVQRCILQNVVGWYMHVHKASIYIYTPFLVVYIMFVYDMDVKS